MQVMVGGGGGKLYYTGGTTIQTASLTTAKCLINSTIDKAKFMSVDIKYYYYGTILERFKYMSMAIKDIPKEVIVQYNFRALQSDSWIYIQIEKGMPGLK